MIQNFDEMVQPSMDKILINLKENQHLASLRDWLLPMLMNGQVTVAEAEKAVYKEEDAMCVAAEPDKNTPKMKRALKNTKKSRLLIHL